MDNICVNRGFFSNFLLHANIYILRMEFGKPGIIHQKERSIIATKDLLNLVVKGIRRLSGWQLKQGSVWDFNSKHNWPHLTQLQVSGLMQKRLAETVRCELCRRSDMLSRTDSSGKKIYENSSRNT